MCFRGPADFQGSENLHRAPHLIPVTGRESSLRKNTIRVAASVVASALSVLGVSPAGVSGAATRAERSTMRPAVTVSGASAVRGAQLWVQRYNDPSNGTDTATAMTVSPSGDTVFVTGRSRANAAMADDYAYATVAYNAATGTQLWVKRYSSPGTGEDAASSVAVSPGGDTVFVTGRSRANAAMADDYAYATIAYNAATGTQLWVKRYHGPGTGPSYATSVAVSPNGSTVFVTGYSYGTTSNTDYATVAYDAVTGAQLWVKRYNGPGNGYDYAHAMKVSPNGGTVFVTGRSYGITSNTEYATVAYKAATGAQLWVKRYSTPGLRGYSAVGLAVSPGGATVFVTGTSGRDYATVAYNAATGAQLWVKRYNWPSHGKDYAVAVGVSPASDTVYVTGLSAGATSDMDYATVAYNAATGAQLWVQRYNGLGNSFDIPRSVAVSPAGDTVYVTGRSAGATSDDYATVAYNAATGAQLWVQRSIGTGNGDDASSVAVSPGGDRVFVTGGSFAATSGFDDLTIAYSG
jgi:outer membrane protein assembly factor BamB